MSAYVVDDRSINRIVSKLHGSRDLTWLHRPLAELGFDNTTEGNIALGQALFQLNVDSVNARYGDGQAAEFRPLDYAHHYEMTSMLQAYKSLKCWIYQACEGDVPLHPLFRFFEDKVLPAFADDIICNLPGYSAAVWG